MGVNAQTINLMTKFGIIIMMIEICAMQQNVPQIITSLIGE